MLWQRGLCILAVKPAPEFQDGISIVKLHQVFFVMLHANTHIISIYYIYIYMGSGFGNAEHAPAYIVSPKNHLDWEACYKHKGVVIHMCPLTKSKQLFALISLLERFILVTYLV